MRKLHTAPATQYPWIGDPHLTNRPKSPASFPITVAVNGPPLSNLDVTAGYAIVTGETPTADAVAEPLATVATAV